jgi:hypothetical protein
MKQIILIAALLIFHQVIAQKNTQENFPPSEVIQKIRITKTASTLKVDGNSYDNEFNHLFSWEYAPLSFIYLIFNDTQTDVFEPVLVNRQLISKITFLKQF